MGKTMCDMCGPFQFPPPATTPRVSPTPQKNELNFRDGLPKYTKPTRLIPNRNLNRGMFPRRRNSRTLAHLISPIGEKGSVMSRDWIDSTDAGLLSQSADFCQKSTR